MKRTPFIDLTCCLFIVLFVYAALTKFFDFEKFRLTIGQSPMLTSFADIISLSVPLTELLMVVALTLPKTRLIGLYAALTLMTAFTTYIIVVSRFSDEVPCSCGGILENLSWTQHLIFNGVFIILAVVAILFYPWASEKENSSAGAYLQKKI